MEPEQGSLGLTSEAGWVGCLAEVVPKSRPNTSRDFLKPPRSSEVRVSASSDAEARSGTSAPPTWWGEISGNVMVNKGPAGCATGHHSCQVALWAPLLWREDPQKEGWEVRLATA
jgi:hypothetical protein